MNQLRQTTQALALSILMLWGLSACAPAEENTRPDHEASLPPSQTQVASSAPQTWPWQVPSDLPPGPAGEQIKLGRALIAETPKYLGPEMPDPAKRVAGNHLACQSCHLNAGQQAQALGFVGITARFPQYRGRENREVTLAERINGCFERSLNGRALPEDSPEMQAMLAYLAWLSQDLPPGAQVAGQGLPPIDLLERAASPELGQQIYATRCALCHQPDGQGLWRNPAQPEQGYVYPALWGPDSFNTGAGMARVITAAKYIQANMPLGTPNLSHAEAFDVAAYINSQARPVKAGLEQDFPDRSKKPVDAAFPPWADSFSAEQHKYGPFQPMMP